jgi:hypothetical protein
MKKFIATGSLLLLVSCQHKVKFHHPTGADSYPIIISDGSTVIRHAKPGRDHFTEKHPRKDEVIKAGRYRPVAIGYHCDPSIPLDMKDACPAKPCAEDTLPTGACKIETRDSTSWNLWLCESPGPCVAGTIHLSWQATGSERINIHSNLNDFVYTGPTGFAGAKVKHTYPQTYTALQSAKLVVNLSTGPHVYVFNCAEKQDCLTIDYYHPQL